MCGFVGGVFRRDRFRSRMGRDHLLVLGGFQHAGSTSSLSTTATSVTISVSLRRMTRTPWVSRPMTLISATPIADDEAFLGDDQDLLALPDRFNTDGGPFLSVTLMLRTPLPPRSVMRYSSGSERLP